MPDTMVQRIIPEAEKWGIPTDVLKSYGIFTTKEAAKEAELERVSAERRSKAHFTKERNLELPVFLQQYLEIKEAIPKYFEAARDHNALLLYRMDEFYELYFDDAEIAAKALGMVLHKRGKPGGHGVSLCYIPVNRSEEFAGKLVEQGYGVAWCDVDPRNSQRVVWRLSTPAQ